MKRGFTVIEIMIVVAIIGLIVAIAVPGFIRSRERARQKACQTNLIRIDQGIQQYVIEEQWQGELALTIPLSYLIGDDSYIRNQPICPSGGTYELHIPNSAQPVTCSIGYTNVSYPHVFPWQEGGS